MIFNLGGGGGGAQKSAIDFTNSDYRAAVVEKSPNPSSTVTFPTAGTYTILKRSTRVRNGNRYDANSNVSVTATNATVTELSSGLVYTVVTSAANATVTFVYSSGVNIGDYYHSYIVVGQWADGSAPN